MSSDLRSPSQPQSITPLWLLPSYTAWWQRHTGIVVDLAGILRGTHGERRRWVGAEWGGVWWECPLFSRLGGLGERRELPQRGPGLCAPAENGFWLFWRPQNAPFCIYMTKNLRGTICTNVPLLHILHTGESSLPWSTPVLTEGHFAMLPRTRTRDLASKLFHR